MGITHQARRPPVRGPRRPAAGRVAARDGQRLRHARRPGGIRNEPKAIRKVEFPDGNTDEPRQAQAQARLLRRRGLRGHEDPRAERAERAPARAPRSAARPPARPAPPTTSTTPGSSATRRDLATLGLGRLLRTRSGRCAACTASTSPAAPSRPDLARLHERRPRATDCDSFPTPTQPAAQPFSASSPRQGTPERRHEHPAPGRRALRHGVAAPRPATGGQPPAATDYDGGRRPRGVDARAPSGPRRSEASAAAARGAGGRRPAATAARARPGA